VNTISPPYSASVSISSCVFGGTPFAKYSYPLAKKSGWSTRICSIGVGFGSTITKSTISSAARFAARSSCGTNGRWFAFMMWASAVTLAISRSAFSLAYIKCRRCPGWTMSNVPWHMMTLFLRGRGPIASRSPARSLILWPYWVFSVSGT
jgi:hypothetical protein